MSDLSKEAVHAAIQDKAATSPPAQDSMFNRFITSLTTSSDKDGNQFLKEIGDKFKSGGCDAISSRPQLAALNRFEDMPTAQKAKVPGSENVAAAAATCHLSK